MKDIIEKITNFINENTMLLIGICAFLIIVLIVYLIDNSIKTRKMQKAIKEMDEVEDKVIDSNLDNDYEDNNVSDTKEDEPKFDSISLVDEDKEYEEDTNEEVKEDKSSYEVEIEETTITPEEPKVEENKFTNKKSLSEILAKKKETINNNDADKTLDETTDFSNTF